MEILRGRKQKKKKAFGNKTTRNKAKEDKKIWKEKEKRNMSSEREIQGNCREHQKLPTCATISVVRRKQLYQQRPRFVREPGALLPKTGPNFQIARKMGRDKESFLP